MKRIIGLGLILVSVLGLSGCASQSPDLAHENTQLKAEIQLLQQEVDGANNSRLKDEIQLLQQEVDSANKKLQEQKELYELRNLLDENWHRVLSALIRGDYDFAQQSLASTVKIKEKKLVFDVNGVAHEFVIPDKPMVFRTSSFMREADNFTAIYEIWDDGYVLSTNDDIYFMYVSYIQENGRWKLLDIEFNA